MKYRRKRYLKKNKLNETELNELQTKMDFFSKEENDIIGYGLNKILKVLGTSRDKSDVEITRDMLHEAYDMATELKITILSTNNQMHLN